jgi:hypothetical protein
MTLSELRTLIGNKYLYTDFYTDWENKGYGFSFSIIEDSKNKKIYTFPGLFPDYKSRDLTVKYMRQVFVPDPEEII